MNRWILPIVLLVILMSACAAQVAVDPTTSPTAVSTESPSASEPLPTVEPSDKEPDEPVTGEVPAAILDDMKDDAAARAGVDRDAVAVVSAEAVTWNDGSLGCPEPGMGYTQALVPGYHVILEAEGVEYDYRAADNGAFKLCENPGEPAGGGMSDY